MFIIVPEKNICASKNFNSRVMLRVTFICHLKKILNPIFLEVCGLATLGISSTYFISIKSVVSNSPTVTDIANSADFWTKAFIDTELSTKAIVTGGMIILGMLLFQAIKSLLPKAAKIGAKVLRGVKMAAIS